MANPQKENGHARVANELLEALAAASLNGREFRVVMAVARETYGFTRKTADLPSPYLSTMTGIAARHCRSVVNELIARSVLYRDSAGHLGIQKNYDLWQSAAPKTGRPENGAPQIQGAPKTGREAPRKRGGERPESGAPATLLLQSTNTTTSTTTNGPEKSKFSCSAGRGARRLADESIPKKIRAAFKAGDIRTSAGCNAIVDALTALCGGLQFDDERVVRAALKAARERRDLANPRGWVVDVLRAPKYAPADGAMDAAKREMVGGPSPRPRDGPPREPVPIGELVGEAMRGIALES